MHIPSVLATFEVCHNSHLGYYQIISLFCYITNIYIHDSLFFNASLTYKWKCCNNSAAFWHSAEMIWVKASGLVMSILLVLCWRATVCLKTNLSKSFIVWFNLELQLQWMLLLSIQLCPGTDVKKEDFKDKAATWDAREMCAFSHSSHLKPVKTERSTIFLLYILSFLNTWFASFFLKLGPKFLLEFGHVWFKGLNCVLGLLFQTLDTFLLSSQQPCQIVVGAPAVFFQLLYPCFQ